MLGKDNGDKTRLSALFRALGSPVRLEILSLVVETQRPLHIKAVAKMLQMDYAAVHRHVGILKRAHLLQIFEVGRSRVLSLLNADVVKKMLALAEQIQYK